MTIELDPKRKFIKPAPHGQETESALKIAIEYAPEVPRACLASQNDPIISINVAKRYACQRIQFGRNVTQKHIHRAHELGLICNLFWSDDPEDGMAVCPERH